MTAAAKALRGPLRKRESHLWERDEHDWYVEPAWVSTRLFEVEKFEGAVWDPACGLGRIPLAAIAAGLSAAGTDIVDRGYGQAFDVRDFVDCAYQWDNVVSNPPFGIAEAFVRRALVVARRKVAMLLPANWVQGDKRSRWLETTPLRRIWFIAPRPSMPPGSAIAAGQKPGNGTTDYAWFVWLREYDGAPEIRWLRRDSVPVALRAPSHPQSAAERIE